MKKLSIRLFETFIWFIWPVILLRRLLSCVVNRVIWYISLVLTRFGPIMKLYRKIAGPDGLLWGPSPASWIWTLRMYMLFVTVTFSTQLTDDPVYFGALVLILAVFVALTSWFYKIWLIRSRKEIIQFIEDLENARQ